MTEPTHNPRLDINKATEFVNSNFDSSVVPSLVEFIKIPNLSRAYDTEWNTNGHQERAAQHVKAWVESLHIRGLKSEIIKEEALSPIIYTEVEGDLPYTVFYYGHFDKQPPMDGWNEGMGALIPVIKNGKLYGRGGADDGYSTYGTFLSILACQQQGLKIPRCVMVTEGDEESGSVHMATYLEKLKSRIGNPLLCFCLDSGTLDYETFWLTNSLRGMLSVTVTVEVLEQGVHSGDASGVVPSSFRVLRQLIERLECAKTGELVQELYHDIPPQRYKELYDVAETLGQAAIKQFPLTKGVKNVTENPLKALIGRGWEPKLAVTGASGFPDVSVAGNVMRSKSTLKLSVRLPPTFDAEEAKKVIADLFTKDVPYNAKVTLDKWQSASGWNAPNYSTYLENAVA